VDIYAKLVAMYRSSKGAKLKYWKDRALGEINDRQLGREVFNVTVGVAAEAANLRAKLDALSP